MIAVPNGAGPVQTGVIQIRKEVDQQRLTIARPPTQDVLLQVAELLARGIDGLGALAIPWPRNAAAPGFVDLVGLTQVMRGDGPTPDTKRILFTFSQGPVLSIVVPAGDMEKVGKVITGEYRTPETNGEVHP